MIRMTRIYCFGRNNWNIIKLGDRAGRIHKQTFLKYSVIADKKNESKIRVDSADARKLKISSSWCDVPRFAESYDELKNSFLREIFYNQSREARGLSRREFALKELFNNIQNFSPPEIIRILKVIAEINTRPVKSLHVLCDLLVAQENWNYTINNIADLLFALTKLSFRNAAVLNLVCTKLKNDELLMTPKKAINVLISLGELRQRDLEVIKKLSEFMLKEDTSIKHSLGCLKAFSILKYSSKLVTALIQSMANLNEVDFENSRDYVNYIWSCIILNRHDLLDLSHFSHVLSEDFILRIISSYPAPNDPVKCKLLQINAAARQIQNYDGPHLQNHPKFKFLNMAVSQKTTLLLQSVQHTLSFVIPKTGTIRTFVQNGTGFSLDIECSLDVKNRKSLQNGKIAIIILNYNDICSDGEVTGIPTFKERVLRHMGYKTLFVKCSEYNPSDPMSDKIALMKRKIKEVLEEDERRTTADVQNVEEQCKEAADVQNKQV